jgi:hypothetical protein
MKIEYTIKEVKPNIFAVIVPDDYHRPMLFCRVQEYYESPNPNFKGKDFNIWDFIEWYSRGKRDAFTYAFDWGGFNIPLKTAWECYEGKDKEPKKGYNGVRSLPDTWKSHYDEVMKDIIWNIESKMFHKKGKRNWNAYIIGAGDTEGETFIHEVCHGLYATNPLYKELADEITQMIPTELYSKFAKNLIDYGYSMEVMDDEIQAYMMTNWETTSFSKKVNIRETKKWAKLYRDTLNSFLENTK